MGCDIHSYAETKKKDKWVLVTDIFPLSDFDKEWDKRERGDHPFDWRSYGLFGFLAGVRNYSEVPTIVEPRGFPEDASDEVKKAWEEWEYGGHTPSWITVKELLDFDYDQVFWDRRVTKVEGNVTNGAAHAEEGEGEHLTIREFLGEMYFKHLEALKEIGSPENTRIVFWFDN